MARPKKNSGAPNAREAIIDAFWKLLEKNRLDEISVGMIASEAGYNRGTFYYHFPDKDALIAAVVDAELADLPHRIFSIVSGMAELRYPQIIDEWHVRRVCLFMEKGGRNIVERKVKDYLINMWSALLSPEGGQLASETRIILEYMSSGTLGVIASLSDFDDADSVAFPGEFLKNYSDLALDQICRAQHVSKDEVVARLHMLDQLSKVQG